MGLVGRRDGRNLGYGRQLSYAGPQALRDMFGGGHYGTVKAHSDRWQAYVRWCRSDDGPGLKDARQIDRQILSDYAAHLHHLVERGDLAIATAQNRLSSVNRTMAALRGDQYVKMPSPSKALEMQRTTIRMTVPQGQDGKHVMRIVDALREQHPVPPPSCSWHAPPACVCARRSWPTCHVSSAKQNVTARSTSRTALKVAEAVLQRLAGSAWMNIFAKRSGTSSRSPQPIAATCLVLTKATWISKSESSALHGTSSICTISKASMNCGQPMLVNDMSKSLIAKRQSTEASSTRLTDTSIRRCAHKSAMSWDTVELTSYPPTSEVDHDQAI